MINRKALISFLFSLLCFLAVPMPALAAPEDSTAYSDSAISETRRSVVTVGGEQASARISEETFALSGPGVSSPENNSDTSPVDQRGESLGMFTTTGYCNCAKCNSGGFALTYSGTVPTGGHTISADLDLYPIGTRLMIGDTIYTVEDKGTHVEGNWLDIYYDTHEAAAAHGMKTEEVFMVISE